MKYKIYKLSFEAPVHFGTGVLNESTISFCSDTLFSAIYIEALKLGRDDELYTMSKEGRLLLSDALPYINDRYFLPKPLLYIEGDADFNQSKKYKKLEYISADSIDIFLEGHMDPDSNSLYELGDEYSQVMAAVRREDETLPYTVGNYLYADGNGLYIIIGGADDEAFGLAEELLESLSYTGIGGKKSSGKGRFVFRMAKNTDVLSKLLERESDRYMLISTALPKDDEIENALDGASYSLQKRSGFVYSATYAPDQMKKRDLYTLKGGSCFSGTFAGDIYDVSENGSHTVYRYAKGMFVGI